MRAHTIATVAGRILMCSLAALAAAPVAWTEAKDAKETFSAFAENVGNVGPAGARTVDISIERWLTDAESDVLRSALLWSGGWGL